MAPPSPSLEVLVSVEEELVVVFTEVEVWNRLLLTCCAVVSSSLLTIRMGFVNGGRIVGPGVEVTLGAPAISGIYILSFRNQSMQYPYNINKFILCDLTF